MEKSVVSKNEGSSLIVDHTLGTYVHSGVPGEMARVLHRPHSYSLQVISNGDFNVYSLYRGTSLLHALGRFNVIHAKRAQSASRHVIILPVFILCF